MYDQWYLYIADIIGTKFISQIVPPEAPKKKSPINVCVVMFVSKGIDDLRLGKIFRSENVVNSLPDSLKREEHVPVVTFKLVSPIRNKILNYKDTVNSLVFRRDGVNNVLENLPECDCATSSFTDPVHGHVCTGDLRIIKNNKLRKLLSKGPNFRVPTTLNYHKCLVSLESALNTTAENLKEKYNLTDNSLCDWKAAIMNAARDKVDILKTKNVPKKTKPVLKDPNVVSYLNDLHSKFVLVPIDKAANNIAIVCKQFYIKRILLEVGLSDNESDTYKISEHDSAVVIDTNIKICETFDLPVTEKHHSLPFMFWTPKMHKNPSGSRFIVASSVCSTKPISTVVSTIFRKIFEQVKSFHSKCLFYRNYNRFWVIQNSKSLIDRLKTLNKKNNAKMMSTFDFSTLYTKLPHVDLIRVLKELVDFVFNGGRKTVDGNRKYLTVSSKLCYFSRKKHGNKSFTCNQIKMLVEHLITETFFNVGNLLFRQCIGIPMGIDPAPFWANLYLYHYENAYVTKLIKSNDPVERFKGFKFKHCFRFIDDCCNINDSNAFSESYKDIYPVELELKYEHTGNYAIFLELDISIVDGVFVYKLFDKRDAFPFFIVRMPDLGGNIPSHVFYGSVFSEFLRIARATLKYTDFVPRAQELYKRMMGQGASHTVLLKQIDKLLVRHPDAFLSFNTESTTIKNDISH